MLLRRSHFSSHEEMREANSVFLAFHDLVVESKTSPETQRIERLQAHLLKLAEETPDSFTRATCRALADGLESVKKEHCLQPFLRVYWLPLRYLMKDYGASRLALETTAWLKTLSEEDES